MAMVVVLGLAGNASAELLAHWRMDDGAGTAALDSTGNGFDGTLNGDAAWAVGQLGGALTVDGSGDYVNCGLMDIDTTVTGGVSACAWIYKPAGGDMKMCGNNQGTNTAGGGFKCAIYNDRMEMDLQDAGGRTLNRDTDGPAVPGDTWVHLAWVYDDEANVFNEYHNGVLADSSTETQSVGVSTSEFRIGSDTPGLGHYFNGMIDDLRVYNHAMTEAEILDAMAGRGAETELASNALPEHEATDVIRDGILSWTPGEFAGTHHVYFGEAFDDVNDATEPTGAGLDANSFDPGRLEFGKTYFWRVDEVNDTADKTVFQGNVWTFEAEPYSIQIAGSEIVVTASSASNDYSLPEKTIDGSGLGEDDTHGIATEAMWFTAMGDATPWIQYEFEGIKQLDIMKVWNSNSTAEGFLGYGVNGVSIEYSTDGQTWETLEAVTELSRAPGLPTYSQYDEIDFGAVAAKMVRLNIQSNFGGFLESYSLSEVQFSMIPAAARTPMPESGSTGVFPNDVVSWRAGRSAAQSTVYVSTDPNEVADGLAASATSNTNSINLSAFDIELGETYYWRVDEVNNAEAVSVWAGPVWSFSTVATLTVDDFESYGNDSPDRPFQTWLDGYGYSADEFFPAGYNGNGTGAGIGHDIWTVASEHYNGNIMETANTIAGGNQSMPFYYSNSGGVASETQRTFAVAQDWTMGRVKTLGLYFYGAPDNGGQLYVKINGIKKLYDLNPTATQAAEWQFWAIDLASLGTNLSNITSMCIGVEGAGSGMILIDDIKLYNQDIQYIEPTQPGTDNLVAQYSFNGSFADSSGQGNNLIPVGSVEIANDGERGQVASFNGTTDALIVPLIGGGTTDALSFSAWVKINSELLSGFFGIFHNDDWSAGDVHGHVSGSTQFTMGTNGLPNLLNPPSLVVDQWYHVMYSLSSDTVSLYVNGVLADSGPGLGDSDATFNLGEGTLGAWSNNGVMERFLTGQLDDVRFYTIPLSADEAAGLAGHSKMYKPL